MSVHILANTNIIAPGSAHCTRLVKDDFTDAEIAFYFKKANGDVNLAIKLLETELHHNVLIDLHKFMISWVFVMSLVIYFFICLRL